MAGTETPDDFAKGTDMNRLSSEHGAMVLCPELTQRANSYNCWNWLHLPHQRRGRGEPELLVSLIHAVITDHRVILRAFLGLDFRLAVP